MLQTHYAVLHAQEETLDRVVAPGLLLYSIYLKLVHSGETIDSLLEMKDVDFARHVGASCQVTCDAGLVPYEKDGTERVVCKMRGMAALIHSNGRVMREVCREGLVFKADVVGTENIVSFCFLFRLGCA
jgi:hypothetical protein